MIHHKAFICFNIIKKVNKKFFAWEKFIHTNIIMLDKYWIYFLAIFERVLLIFTIYLMFYSCPLLTFILIVNIKWLMKDLVRNQDFSTLLNFFFAHDVAYLEPVLSMWVLRRCCQFVYRNVKANLVKRLLT